MEEKKLNQIRERVLKNKALAEIVNKYLFEISVKERGQFLSLIEESYKVGVKDGSKLK